MAIYAKANVNHTGRERMFEPCPSGVQRLVCVDVVDLGLVDVTWLGQTHKRHKVQLRWQSEHLTSDGKPYLVLGRYTLSMHEKANLRVLLESWRGRKFKSNKEAEAFDVESVLGAQAFANVEHNKVGDRIFANVTSIMSPPKNMEPLKIRDYVRVCERDGYKATTVPPAEDDFHAIAEPSEEISF